MPSLPFFSRKMSTDTTSTSSTTDLNARAELATLTSPSTSTIQSLETVNSIPYSGRISPSAAAAVGWGKVIAEGGFLSVHTLGTVNGKNLDLTTNLIRRDSTTRLAELRALMRAEPEPLDF